ncbi:MAG: magnesium transporter [Oscillospiraceae bacterium]|nr:magnesium transporter [Oscillospiraceae bacterium]
MHEELENITEMTEDNALQKPDFRKELYDLITEGNYTSAELRKILDDYHDNDIAAAITDLSPEKRRSLYRILDDERISDIFAYIDDVEEYIAELDCEKAADIIEQMDADDAVDVLDELDEEQREAIINLMDDEAQADINLIDSYSDELIGSRMTTNFVTVKKSFSVKQAMTALISQAAENDNITTIYALNDDDTFYGAIELRNLIIARANIPLEDIISTYYPFVYASEEISECIEDLKDYSEDSIPVLSADNMLIGVITATDIIEVVDDEMSDDYAKLAGLAEESDLHESVMTGVSKRIPWLVVLLCLSLLVSTVVGAFEQVISGLTLIVCFQSLILGMSGNVGTQSLAVTIRVLVDEDLSLKEKLALVFKEVRIGAVNGFLLGIASTVIIGLYIIVAKDVAIPTAFLISGCVGLSLMFAMLIASAVGTAVPMIIKALKFDPAVASGPLITTVNDLVSVTVYYGLAWLLLINIFNIT